MTTEAAGSVLGAGNPAPAGDGGAGGNGAAAPVEGWAGTLPEGVRGIVTTKGWKGPEDAITSYANLEKLLGADKAGRGVVIPKDDAPAEELAAFYSRLGRPENADAYKIPVPEGDDGAFLKTAAGWFHESGLSQKQAEGLAGKWNAHVASIQQAEEARIQQETAIGLQNLKRDWGQEYDAQLELGRRAVREAGIGEDDAAAIERAIGVEKAAKYFAKLGAHFREAPMRGAEGQGNFGPMTPEAAKARITALMQDQDWGKRFAASGADEMAEWRRLHAIAYGA